jgi:hypothetical protein
VDVENNLLITKQFYFDTFGVVMVVRFITTYAISACHHKICEFELVMVFNATSNSISVILWQSVLMVEETGVPGENDLPAASH